MSNLTLGIPKTFQEICRQANILEEEMLALHQLWNCPKVKAAVVLQAFSIPQHLIEESFGVSAEDLACVVKYPEAKDLITKWSLKLKQYDGKNAHSRLLPLALLAQETILVSPTTNARTRLSVASEIIDRVKGKPKQSLEVSSTSLNINADLSENNKRIDAAVSRIKELTEKRQTLVDAQSNAKPR